VAADCVRAGQRRAVPAAFWSQVEPDITSGCSMASGASKSRGAGGDEERVDDPALQREVGVGPGAAWTRWRPCWPAARGVRGPFHDLRDLREQHREDVVQHEREPLRG
jgi:hypothetical protein